jgi:outer membrane lipoprotein carrier protein
MSTIGVVSNAWIKRSVKRLVLMARVYRNGTRLGWLLLSVCAVSLLVNGPVMATPVEGAAVISAERLSAADRLIQSLASTQSLTADFVQVTAAKSARQRVSSGSLWISKPGLLRWETKKPYPQLQILDGEQFWLYDPDLMQATVRPVAAANLSGVAALLLNSGPLAQETLLARYEFQELPDRERLSWVQVTPKSPEPGLTKILVGIDAQALTRAFEIHDSLGQITRVDLSNVVKNKVLDVNLFKFNPPKGVNILRGP